MTKNTTAFHNFALKFKTTDEEGVVRSHVCYYVPMNEETMLLRMFVTDAKTGANRAETSFTLSKRDARKTWAHQLSLGAVRIPA